MALVDGSAGYNIIGPRGPRVAQWTGGRRRRLLLYSINSGFFCLQNSTGVRVGITISVSLEEKCPVRHVAAPVEHTGVGILLVPTQKLRKRYLKCTYGML